MTSVFDLPEVEPGDWGWCLREPMNDGEPWQLVFYDDDESECSEGIDDDEHECGDAHDCYEDLRAIVYRNEDIAGLFHTVPHDMLRLLPGQYILPDDTRGDGFVYAISLVPELDIGRLKVGYTARSIEHRLAQYRTANPTAILLGLWAGDRAAEHAAHAALSGRLGVREVFQVDDIAAALEAINRALRGQP